MGGGVYFAQLTNKGVRKAKIEQVNGRLVIFYLKCAAYKSTYLLTYLHIAKRSVQV